MADFRTERRGERPIPYIDRNVEHVGVSSLRQLDGKKLRKLDKTFVIQEHNAPLAVLLSYEQYLIIQDQLQSVMDTVEVLANPSEMEMLISGFEDARKGQTRDLEEIRSSLKEKKK
jgi:PHD/YefM family antitoxin component YafN of YafNO toxin-antitoxin module